MKIKLIFNKKFTVMFVSLFITSLFILSYCLYGLKIYILPFIFYPVLILLFLFLLLFRFKKLEWIKPKITKEDKKYFAYIDGLKKEICNVFNFTHKKVRRK